MTGQNVNFVEEKLQKIIEFFPLYRNIIECDRERRNWGARDLGRNLASWNTNTRDGTHKPMLINTFCFPDDSKSNIFLLVSIKRNIEII